ncbi:type 1 glutamine amidotransferase domain-containing protein [Streptomyces sp. NPDC059866]|uniref:type 1 glutamine amidotransferase domain-containing protein n=1 Tax=Streptomyces sp. NPDC059866 TaxID=3346978 RepID=UPI0036697978
MTAPKRMLYVLTSHDVLGDGGRPTGFHLGETVQPWLIACAAGYEVDFASVMGGKPPMIGHDLDRAEETAFLADADVRDKLDHTLTPEEVDASRYAGVFFVGGHGTMWDFRGNARLESTARSIYEAGGVIAAICHGQAALVDLTLSDGSYLVAGKALTAFSNEGEAARGLTDVVPFSLQSMLEARGAVYSCAPDRTAHVVVSERLVTGQNPASAPELGRRMVALLGQ